MKKTKSYYILKHILCCIFIILLFAIYISKANALSKDNLKPYLTDSIKQINKNIINTIEVIKYDQPRIIENDIYVFLQDNKDILTFYSNIFDFDIEYIKSDLVNKNINYKKINKNNIGRITDSNNELINYPSVEYGISEYFFEIENQYSRRNIEVIPYNGNNKYIENLIIYFTKIYNEVDTTLALSIGAAESGYYKVKYMLNNNNIYGGMSSTGLITYNNIEIGTLKYIRLLAKSYFQKGLTTKSSIGKKYCPQFTESGDKIASEHWINLVSKAETTYKNYNNNITIKDIIKEYEIQ